MKNSFYFLLVTLILVGCKNDGPQIVNTTGSGATVSTLAGSINGYADGVGAAAMFASPQGITVDFNGNIYVADKFNQKIRKVTSTGTVTTLAGSSAGYVNGLGSNAKFNYPSGVTVDALGNIYVADTENHSIRKVTSAGSVTTLAGGTAGNVDGTGANASFNFPQGLVVDPGGNVYVADTENFRIRKITAAGVVTTFAGSTEGFTDGTGTGAQFTFPTSIAIDASGALYVTDAYKIRKITSAGVVTTLAGGSTSGFEDGIGTAARFSNPFGVAVDGSGNVFVTDSDNHKIRKITSSGLVTTLAGSIPGYLDGEGKAAQFNIPTGIVLNPAQVIYVAEQTNNKIRKIVQ
ncbi:MAG TPA: NHL repeat-containing protein [Cyclobacteriaceae bacterium]|nr:NHL repeat-containing protein [Cyclobacteriaceae bacterium]